MARKKAQTAPAEGERRAMRGYTRQYDCAAAAVYAELSKDELLWVGVADREAGILDDIVLGLRGRVIGHQFKHSQYPESFRLRTLFLGTNGIFKSLAQAWRRLRVQFDSETIEVRFVTNNYPTTSDKLIDDSNGHSAAFLADLSHAPDTSLAEWERTKWFPFIKQLFEASNLERDDFEEFFRSFRLLTGSAADFSLTHRLPEQTAEQVRQIANILPRLAADGRDKDRWNRTELLAELGWPDSFSLRRLHQFPVGIHVQRNWDTENKLLHALQAMESGYVALVGHPGTGKSTLLQSSLVAESGIIIIRYLAFVPGEGQGIGRGEAESFLDDVNTQLKRSHLSPLRHHDSTLLERREQFEHLLSQAGRRFQEHGVRTIIVVDGLDHIPREEMPERSLIAELPIPQSIPIGVIFILGTQRLDLLNIPPKVFEQASTAERCIEMSPLPAEAVFRMMERHGLDPEIPRERVYEICRGQPLVTHYLIEVLKDADAAKRRSILDGEFIFDGDIEAVYASAWREIDNDTSAKDVLQYIAHAEGPISPELLAKATSDIAVERALCSTKHLLSINQCGWSTFHNSFRLYILSKPHLRFGQPDTAHRFHVYQKLAELVGHPIAGRPQCWLELRYRAHAEQHEAVLHLAQPSRFRRQLAEGRSTRDIQADIRLAFKACKELGNEVDVFRLLLASDEISRRSTALGYASNLPKAMLALGDIDSAQAASERRDAYGYDLIIALLAIGQRERARQLFDQIDPVEEILSGQQFNFDNSLVRNWAKCVYAFRDKEFILHAIKLLSKSSAEHSLVSDQAALEDSLRLEVAISIVGNNRDADPSAIGQAFEVPTSYLPYLDIEAAERELNHRMQEKAASFIRSATDHSTFWDIENSWRRRVALIAAEIGQVELASKLFQSLIPPNVAKMGDVYSKKTVENNIDAVVNHAILSAMIGQPPPQADETQHSPLSPLQHHASWIGTILGRLRAGVSVFEGEVQRATKAMLIYFDNLRATNSENAYVVAQAISSAPELAQMFLEAAKRVSTAEFNSVVAEFDNSFAHSSQNVWRLDLRRQFALTYFNLTGDKVGAIRRIEPLVDIIHESTPEQQIDLLATLVNAYAHVGDPERAKSVLSLIHKQSLGYALAPKKDAQYVLWRDLLRFANSTDPDRRSQRVNLILRQLSGLMETEGEAAGKRIAAAVLAEAALAGSGIGISVARVMGNQGMLSWDGIVNALLMAVVTTRSDLAGPCIRTWCSLALPYYAEPYYRADQTGDFLITAFTVIGEDELHQVLSETRTAIESQAQSHIRVRLLGCLVEAISQRGITDKRLQDALVRWQAETPTEKDHFTPGDFDNVASIEELELKIKSRSTDLSLYSAAEAFARLIKNTGFEQAVSYWERLAELHNMSKARFGLCELSIFSEKGEFAHSLLNEYIRQPGDRSTWSYWSGAERLKYYKLKLQLNDEYVHRDAFSDLLGELSAGREDVNSLLVDTEDIIPIIEKNPNWPAMWDLLAEQLQTTREFGIGRSNSFNKADIAEEELISDLYQWAFSLPIPELIWHARLGAVQLLQTPSNKKITEALLNRLLSGDEDEPADALQIILFSGTLLSAEFGERISVLTDHPDYAVAVMANRLAEKWSLTGRFTPSKLPAFYSLHLPNDDHYGEKEQPSILSSALTVCIDDLIEWTQAFPTLVNSLGRKINSSSHIRHRCKMFVEEWGGGGKFGKTATKQLEAKLKQLDMRITYTKPKALGTARGLRYVAGELLHAGLLGPSDEPWLIQMMGYAPILCLQQPEIRPNFLKRPSSTKGRWGKEVENWAKEVSLDVLLESSDEYAILAEWSHFIMKDIRRKFELHRIRAPFLEVKASDEVQSWLLKIPRAIWIGAEIPLSEEFSPFVIRRLQQGFKDVPYEILTICPHWLTHLQWHKEMHAQGTYLDATGEVMARQIWWRDGGPMDVSEDAEWGEGFLIVVTQEGLKQLSTIFDVPLEIRTYARRQFMSDAGNPVVEWAQANETI